MGRLEELQDKVGVSFRDPALLREALTHSSFANESPHVSPRDNERLEYLGDAVLQLITAEYLFKLKPGAKEGEMTQLRSAMVNTNTLAALAEELGLGDFLFLGKGIAKGGGRSLRSLLANGFESVLGAIFLDAGYDAAYHYYLDRFRALPEPVQDENYKGRLQQVVQERYGLTPYYDSAGARGGRQREYTAVVYAGADPLGTGHGSTKQAAEQEAAHNALAELERRAAARKGGRQRRPRAGAEAADVSESMLPEEPEVESGPLQKAVALAAAGEAESPPDEAPAGEPAPQPPAAVVPAEDPPAPAPPVETPPAAAPSAEAPPVAMPPSAAAPPAAEAPPSAAAPPAATPAAEAPPAETKPKRRTRRPRKVEEPPAPPAAEHELAEAPGGSSS
ncbi:MAG TPA: ribonuclease III [Candidatus Dormibacteraeota bacterium]